MAPALQKVIAYSLVENFGKDEPWALIAKRKKKYYLSFLFPFQLMCGMGPPLVSAVVSRRQTAALGSAPDLTETSPSISHVI